MCSGTLIVDATGDFRAFFLTANHCGIAFGNASTVVVYWNYESPTCGNTGQALAGTKPERGDLSGGQVSTWTSPSSS